MWLVTVLLKALMKADIPISKEPIGLICGYGKRPNGPVCERLVHCLGRNNHCLLHSYHVDNAAGREHTKYSFFPHTSEFVPMFVESLDHVNCVGCEVLMELRIQMTAISGNPLETRLSFPTFIHMQTQIKCSSPQGTITKCTQDENHYLQVDDKR